MSKLKLITLEDAQYVNVNDLIHWFEDIKANAVVEDDKETETSLQISIKLLLVMLDRSDKMDVKKVYFSKGLVEF